MLPDFYSTEKITEIRQTDWERRDRRGEFVNYYASLCQRNKSKRRIRHRMQKLIASIANCRVFM